MSCFHLLLVLHFHFHTFTFTLSLSHMGILQWQVTVEIKQSPIMWLAGWNINVIFSSSFSSTISFSHFHFHTFTFPCGDTPVTSGSGNKAEPNYVVGWMWSKQKARNSGEATKNMDRKNINVIFQRMHIFAWWTIKFERQLNDYKSFSMELQDFLPKPPSNLATQKVKLQIFAESLL